MTPLTAGEAIGPAWHHTKALLFHNRRVGRILKLCLVGLGAQLTISFNSFSNLRSNPGVAPAIVPMLVVFAVVGTVVSLALGVVFLYLGSRLQLVLFDIIVLRDDRVGPAWTRHGHHTWRWAGIKVVGMLIIGVVLSPLLIPAIGGFFALMHSIAPAAGTPPHPPTLNLPAFRAFSVVFGQFFAVILLFSVFFQLFVALTQPVLALGDRSFTEVFRQAGRFVAAEPGAVAAYALLQMLVIFALGIVVIAAWAVAAAIPTAILGLAGWAFWSLLHGSLAGSFMLGTLGVIAGVVLVAWALLTYIVALGTVVIFAEAYALYFMAGRYPLLGQYMQVGGFGPARPLGFPEQPILGFRD